MPACRTNKPAKRSPVAAGSQLVWAIDKPQVAVSVSVDLSLSAADMGGMYPDSGADSTMTLAAMDSPPPLVDYPSTGEFIMFPPPSNTLSPARRAPHSKKKPENHIPRPPNAFILFRSSFIKSQHVSTDVETNHSTLSKIIGLTWSSMREEERQVWYAKAKEALDEHRRRFPKYSFRPTQSKARAAAGAAGSAGDGGAGCAPAGSGGGGGAGEKEKRRVREVEPKDITRCAKIAQLLVEGKKGAELNAAVREFDKTHVPQIVTRFEAPITARQFRRSSSAPVPDAEESCFLAHVQSGKSAKPRARSTRPTRSVSPTPAAAAASETERAAEHYSPASAAGAPTLDAALPHDLAPFTFGEFTFDSTAPLPDLELECDPLSSPFAAFPTSFPSFAPTPDAAFSPASNASVIAAAAGLTIDTSFAHNTWPTALSEMSAPQTPQTPYTTTTSLLSSPLCSTPTSSSASASPLSAASPFGDPSAFDAFDAFFADAAQLDFQASFGVVAPDSMAMCGAGAGLSGAYVLPYASDPGASAAYLGMGTTDMDMGLDMNMDAMGFAEYLRVPAAYA